MKECKDRSVLLYRMWKNAKNVPFFYKERERTQERCVLLKSAKWKGQEYNYESTCCMRTKNTITQYVTTLWKGREHNFTTSCLFWSCCRGCVGVVSTMRDDKNNVKTWTNYKLHAIVANIVFMCTYCTEYLTPKYEIIIKSKKNNQKIILTLYIIYLVYKWYNII